MGIAMTCGYTSGTETFARPVLAPLRFFPLPSLLPDPESPPPAPALAALPSPAEGMGDGSDLLFASAASSPSRGLSVTSSLRSSAASSRFSFRLATDEEKSRDAKIDDRDAVRGLDDGIRIEGGRCNDRACA
jgi:hypothetical protein